MKERIPIELPEGTILDCSILKLGIVMPNGRGIQKCPKCKKNGEEIQAIQPLGKQLGFIHSFKRTKRGGGKLVWTWLEYCVL